MEGLFEFSELVHLVAKDCLENRVFVADTAEHKFDVVAAALRSAKRVNGERPHMHALSFRRAARYCNIVPDLNRSIG